MNRSQKEAVVAEVREGLLNSAAIFLVNYKGASVGVLESFRGALREQGGSFRVAKARLMRRAAEDVPGSEAFSGKFREQVGLVFSGDEIPGLAKALVSFAKDNEAIKVLAGFFEQKVLSKEQVKYFALLPSREVLLGQVVGTLQAPIAQFVRLLNLLIVRLLYVLQRFADKKEAAV